MPYQTLDADKLIETIRVLRDRIHERFPGAGLLGVCDELVLLARKARDSADWITRPNLPLRIAIGALVALIVAGIAVSIYSLRFATESVTVVTFVQLLEAAINDVVLIGLGVFFLVTLERRLKRKKVLRAIAELRSVAHIVDMHQLTKDPGHKIHVVVDTRSSPRRSLTGYDLTRYLDYCAEMLSLTGKIAALYVENYDDAVVLASVNEVEALTTGLSGKVWQKLMILETSGVAPDLDPA